MLLYSLYYIEVMAKFILFLFASQKILFNTNGGIYTYSKILGEYVILVVIIFELLSYLGCVRIWCLWSIVDFHASKYLGLIWFSCSWSWCGWISTTVLNGLNDLLTCNIATGPVHIIARIDEGWKGGWICGRVGWS